MAVVVYCYHVLDLNGFVCHKQTKFEEFQPLVCLCVLYLYVSLKIVVFLFVCMMMISL